MTAPPTNQIILGDCLQRMKEWPDECIDLICTDPPWGISQEIKINRSKNSKYKGPDINLNFGAWDIFDGDDDFWQFTLDWLKEVAQILRPGGMLIFWFDKDKIGLASLWLNRNGFKCKDYFADIISNPVPQFRKVSWMSGWNIVGMWQKIGGPLTYNWQEGQHKNWAIRAIVGGRERTVHPTQKPLLITSDFIRWWSKESDLILDPFCGSGTTCVAAQMLKRNYIGIEKEPTYYEIAKQRITSVEAQGMLL